MSSLRGSTGRRGSGPVYLHFLKRARPRCGVPVRQGDFDGSPNLNPAAACRGDSRCNRRTPRLPYRIEGAVLGPKGSVSPSARLLPMTAI
jgi:hypothetical protein